MDKKLRILNCNRYLTAYLREGEEFYVGLLYEDFIKFGKLEKYNLPDTFSEENSFIPLGKGSVSKANINGKYVRKNPEEKESKIVHIDYRRKKDGRQIKYDREYFVYIKELLHKYNLSLSFHTNKHGQKVVVTEILKYDDSEANNLKNTHAINIFCEIFNTFEIFNINFEPAIHFNKRFEMELLPKGTLSSNEIFNDVLSIASHYTKNETEKGAFQKRLSILQKFNPDIRGKGPHDFYGYIVFGFSEIGIVLLESMYSENATYAFKIEDYEMNIIKDKQTVKREKQILRKFYHYENWESNITKFLNSRTNMI